MFIVETCLIFSLSWQATPATETSQEQAKNAPWLRRTVFLRRLKTTCCAFLWVRHALHGFNRTCRRRRDDYSYRESTIIGPAFPANTTRWNNDVLMLGQRRRRWPNIKTALFQRCVFAGFTGRRLQCERIGDLSTPHYIPASTRHLIRDQCCANVAGGGPALISTDLTKTTYLKKSWA